MATSKYKRILLKISGEIIKGKRKYGIDPDFLDFLADEIKDVLKTGVQIAIVPGGGNIFRGLSGSKKGMDRATADYMGMLATVFNSLALKDALEKKGVKSRVQTSITMKEIAEPYIRGKALRHLEKGRTVILGSGTGLPFITTDTAAAIRGLELKCQAIFKATKVDGIYTDDPIKNSKAKKFKKLSFSEAIKNDKISIMDDSAISLCRESNVQIIVFNMNKKGNLKKAILGQKLGTIIN
ncbi:UMP kinase [Candidatus Beckwithbacteria bacterium CG10_big_fil_rev_8_21_14_0_10_34_10]|uniref:Uridylate kinase n=1 Tax=Candidatus Beckwithbacteria bacterium CG10_big_fil_rev_8_21_14_0_10_34_10 TaxID=1974495 RepID=A0A2H0WC98_9BACT|nr:MAG: UMP kinase [Candidatus Beckwithbacteria bacterium CG10_big_fil_rev_8_21_14_0_10_34_10]